MIQGCYNNWLTPSFGGVNQFTTIGTDPSATSGFPAYQSAGGGSSFDLGASALNMDGNTSGMAMMMQFLFQMLGMLSMLMSSFTGGNAFSGALGDSSQTYDNYAGAPAENAAYEQDAGDEVPESTTASSQGASDGEEQLDVEENPDQGGNATKGTKGASGASKALTKPDNAIDVKELGAKGDGSADDQAILQKALDQAKATGQPVWIPEGTYKHSGVLNADGVKIMGAGDQSVLKATNPDQAAIKLTGDGASLSGIKTEVEAPNRSSMPDAAAVLVQNATNASVSNVTVQGAASNGIRLDNATGATIANNLVLGTNADGIALMNGSSGNMVKKNVVYQAGDDSFSDDSYQGDAKQDEGNTFDSNVSLDNAYGRGITLAGSKNDKVINNIVSGSKWIGIWGDTDPDSGTMQSSGHQILNNVVINNPNGEPVRANGSKVSGTKTDGSVPDLSSILGWDPGELPDRYSFNRVYKPGTGSGAANSGGVRT